MAARKFGILCFSHGFGGLEINTLRLAGWMQDAGWEVPLLLRDASAICRAAIDQQLMVTALAGSNAANELKLLHRWIEANGIGVLLIPFNRDIRLASLYKRFFNRRIKLVYQQHMQVGVSKRDFIHTLRYNMLDAWISPLDYLKAETLQKTTVPARKISVIPFGIDSRQFATSNWTRDTARQSFNLPLAPKLIGVLGRIDPKKGQDLVIKGIDALNTQHGKDYHLLLLGDATLNEGDAFSMQLRALVNERHLQDRVHFRAYQPDVMQFFRAIDLFAMPSHGETYGMVTLEAMAAGVPVVGTDRDGTRELLGEGRYGRLFPLNDVAAFCSCVMATARDPALPEQLLKARERVYMQFGHERMCAAIGALADSFIS